MPGLFFPPTLFLMQIFPVEAVVKAISLSLPFAEYKHISAGRSPKRSIQLVLSAEDWLEGRRTARKPCDRQSQLNLAEIVLCVLTPRVF